MFLIDARIASAPGSIVSYCAQENKERWGPKPQRSVYYCDGLENMRHPALLPYRSIASRQRTPIRLQRPGDGALRSECVRRTATGWQWYGSSPEVHGFSGSQSRAAARQGLGLVRISARRLPPWGKLAIRIRKCLRLRHRHSRRSAPS